MKNSNVELLRDIRIHLVLGLKDNGRRLTIKCPIHNEKTASFCLYPSNNYYCFGCGISGQNAIDLLLQSGLSFPEAIEELKQFV